MSATDAANPDICPDCGEELWYDQEEGCWVCETCGIEFYEEDWEEEWEEEEWEEEEEEEAQEEEPPQP